MLISGLLVERISGNSFGTLGRSVAVNNRNRYKNIAINLVKQKLFKKLKSRLKTKLLWNENIFLLMMMT